MKPDWSTAPEWAKFLTMDDDGMYCWWQCRPVQGAHNWIPSGRGKFQPCNCFERGMFIEERSQAITSSGTPTVVFNAP